MAKQTVSEIKSRLQSEMDITADFLAEVATDERKSVQQLLKQYEKRQQQRLERQKAHIERLQIETQLYAQGMEYIVGIDEVGRGPLAGPVVTAAVILPKECHQLVGVNDSKQLSHKKRCEYAQLIREVALDIQIHTSSIEKIDTLNIYQATRYSMLQAVQQLTLQPDYLLIDAMALDTDIPQQSIIKGDQKSLSIAAASIIAKVYRDELMTQYAQQYPEFGFEQNAGYGTVQHLEALAQYGYTPIHRKSFAPISQMTKQYSS